MDLCNFYIKIFLLSFYSKIIAEWPYYCSFMSFSSVTINGCHWIQQKTIHEISTQWYLFNYQIMLCHGKSESVCVFLPIRFISKFIVISVNEENCHLTLLLVNDIITISPPLFSSFSCSMTLKHCCYFHSGSCHWTIYKNHQDNLKFGAMIWCQTVKVWQNLFCIFYMVI